MRAAPWIRETDCLLATLLAQALDEREALRDLLAESPTVEGSKGQVRAHPYVMRLRDVEAHVGEWARLLLLDPRQRVELGLATEKARTLLDELRERRRAFVDPARPP